MTRISLGDGGSAWYRRLEARVAASVALLVAGSLAAVLVATTRTITTRSLDRAVDDLAAAHVAFEHLAEDRAAFASAQASLVTALPVFRAHLTDLRLSGDPATLEALAHEYQRQLNADLLVVGGPTGTWIAQSSWPDGTEPAAVGDAIASATAGRSSRGVVAIGDQLFLIVSEPAWFANEVLGTLTVGYALDDAFAARLAAETHCQINIGGDGVVYASSLPPSDRAALVVLVGGAELLQADGSRPVRRIGSGDYVVGTYPLSADGAETAHSLILMEDWGPTKRFVDEIRNRLLMTGAVILTLAVTGGLFFSRRVSQPLWDVAQAARAVAGGDWERQVPRRGSVEATMTADAFNAMSTSLRHWYEEARKRDDQLRQAQKLEALGRLAGGLAHDFNNLLMAIRGYAELLLQTLTNDPRRVDAEEIMKAADRAAALTRQILTFSRRQLVTPRVLAPGEVVASAEQMLRRLIGEDISLTTVIPEGLATVRADASQLEQVVLNLAINARDAMPRGGALHFALANVEIADAPTVGPVPALTPRRYVRLSVADTGCGMSPETLSHIFEPFFTTKEEGLGTGLGLAMVYGIVEQAGGAIDVETAIDRGTTFHIYLPALVEGVEADTAPAASDVGTRMSGWETVLLVEDDPQVGGFVTKALRSAGYTVLHAADASQALDIVLIHNGPIHLLLTDVVMPNMNGRELAAALVTLRGKTAVLYMSGHSDDAILRQGIERAAVHFLPKPFSIATLTAKIREALGVPAI